MNGNKKSSTTTDEIGVNSEKLIWSFPKSTLDPGYFSFSSNYFSSVSSNEQSWWGKILKGLACIIDTWLINELLIEWIVNVRRQNACDRCLITNRSINTTVRLVARFDGAKRPDKTLKRAIRNPCEIQVLNPFSRRNSIVRAWHRRAEFPRISTSV